MPDDDILRGLPNATAVEIASRLDGDAIISRVELAIFDQHIPA
jgi:hypothetical protein